MKRIWVSLTSKGSIDKAVKELRRYKQSIETKNEVFVRRLAELGIPIIDARISAAQGDSDPNHYAYIKVLSYGDYSEAQLVVEGRDIMFFEFGAGIHYNGAAGTSKRKREDFESDSFDYHISGGAELGYTIGSYGKGQGKQNAWAYRAETGEIVISHGTEATMPLHSATVEIINNIEQIAKSVFGGS